MKSQTKYKQTISGSIIILKTQIPHDWIVNFVQVRRVVDTRSKVGQVTGAIVPGRTGFEGCKLAAVCCCRLSTVELVEINVGATAVQNVLIRLSNL